MQPNGYGTAHPDSRVPEAKAPIGARKQGHPNGKIARHLTYTILFGVLNGLPTIAWAGNFSSLAPQLRTYVSGQGSDTNGCTVTTPCKTLKAALALTTAGGEIFVLNSADYGPATITKSVSIVSEGAAGGMLATNGTVAITINAG